jgi:hypothetical protein
MHYFLFVQCSYYRRNFLYQVAAVERDAACQIAIWQNQLCGKLKLELVIWIWIMEFLHFLCQFTLISNSLSSLVIQTEEKQLLLSSWHCVTMYNIRCVEQTSQRTDTLIQQIQWWWWKKPLYSVYMFFANSWVYWSTKYGSSDRPWTSLIKLNSCTPSFQN